jgi:hypothetical protein
MWIRLYCYRTKAIVKLKTKKMKALTHCIFVVLLVTVALTSCSIEKRLYSSGYNINFRGEKGYSQKEESKSVFKEQKVVSAEARVVADTLLADNQSASVNKEEVLLIEKQEAKTYSNSKVELNQKAEKGFVKFQPRKERRNDSIFERYPWGVAAIIVLVGLILLWIALWIFFNAVAPGIGGV